VRVPFDAQGLLPRRVGDLDLWPLEILATSPGIAASTCEVGVVSMGNPHAVQRVGDVQAAPVAILGPLVEHHRRFPQRVNAGFVELLSREAVKLRVHERGAGETLACGTGACAAVAAGIRAGWLDARVDVHTRGGRLTIEWAGGAAPVLMTGPAEFVFEGEITL
jgi:diaminopimelate epimerase